ncbi:MAG: hypothetical protein SNJ79_10755, partial [Sphingomonadaceae bacterium]
MARPELQSPGACAGQRGRAPRVAMSLFPDVEPYRVLARKYRPADFSALIGQEAMVQTLANAIAS